MNELVYVFQENKVRVTTINTEPWFALVDVCAVLGIKNSRDVWNRLDDDEKAGVDFIDTSSNGVTQRRRLQAVNEPGLYDTIIRSNSEQAKPFRRWITHEVIPSIRKTGYYTALTPEDTIKALAKGMEYDHFMEDVVFPAIEMQDEFTFDKLLEHYCGYPVSSMDDLKHAKTIFNQTSKERKQRLSELRYNVNDYVNDDDMYRRISRFKWSAPENRGHYKTIKGVRWFDDFIMEKLKGENTYV